MGGGPALAGKWVFPGKKTFSFKEKVSWVPQRTICLVGPFLVASSSLFFSSVFVVILFSAVFAEGEEFIGVNILRKNHLISRSPNV